MTKTLSCLLRTGLALSCVLVLTACKTIQYREVQSDFERAVAAETARAESPFVDWYRGVATTLTSEYIGRLDAKLRPNAWMLRSISEWRTADYSNALASANSGLAEIQRQEHATPELAQSRDAVVLTLLPGLVQDSMLRDRLAGQGTNVLTARSYRADFLPQFRAVLTTFEESKQHFGTATPRAVREYWNFQLWRILQNWSFVLGRLLPGEESTRQAYSEVDALLAGRFSALSGSTNLAGAIQSAKTAIPADHAYRRLIEFEEQR